MFDLDAAEIHVAVGSAHHTKFELPFAHVPCHMLWSDESSVACL